MPVCCRSLTAGCNGILPSLSHRIFLSSQNPVSEFPRFSTTHHRLNQQRGIVLRSRRLWVIEAVGPAGAKTTLKLEAETNEKARRQYRCSYAVGGVEDCRSNGENEEKEGSSNRTAEVIIAAAVTVILGVGNRVLYKLALVPLKHYPFFLAQLATFGYVLVYFSILYLRYHAGKVTNEMLALPKTLYLAVGLLEALGAACGMAAGELSHLATPSIIYFPWSKIRVQPGTWVLSCGCWCNNNCSKVPGFPPIKVQYLEQFAFYFTSGSSAGSLMEGGIFWSLLMIASFLFQAADTVLKEIIFLNAAKRLEGGTVDLFVVNSFGSAFQAIFICLLLPFLSKLWGIPFDQLSSYLKDGAACFLNLGSVAPGCDGAPLLPLLFVIVNMGFNVSLLHLIKISSAVVSCLVSTISVPIAVFLFTLPLPYLSAPSSLPSGFVAGVIILVVGMVIYVWTPLWHAAKDNLPAPS